jgi:hypothetical protein
MSFPNPLSRMMLPYSMSWWILQLQLVCNAGVLSNWFMFIDLRSSVCAGGTLQPSLAFDSLSPEFTLGLALKNGLKFKVDPPVGFLPSILVDLRWCSTGRFNETGLSVAGNTSLRLVNMNSDGTVQSEYEVAVVDGSLSRVSPDGRCFQLRVQTVNLTMPLPLIVSGIEVSTRQNTTKSTVQPFSPDASGAGIAFVYSPQVPLSVPMADPGTSVHINDIDPPQIIGCPGDIVASVTPPSMSAAITWISPTATDNIQVVQFTSNYSPGSAFSLINSPYNVTYTAMDPAGLITRCSFLVSVIYVKDFYNASLSIDSAAIHYELTQTWIGTYINADYLLDAKNSSNVSLSMQSHKTATTITFTAQNGADAFAFRPSSTAASIKLEIDLTFATTPNYQPTHLGDTNVYANVDLLDLRTLDGSALASSSNFGRATTAKITYIAGNYMRIATLSDELVSSKLFPLRFSGIRVTLNTPQNVNNTNSTSTVFLRQASFIRFVSTFDPVPGASFDASHNSDFLRVYDDVAPNITGCPASVAKPCEPNAEYAHVVWAEPQAHDDRAATLVNDAPEDRKFFIGTRLVTYTATDVYGNSAVCKFNVTILDTQVPTIQCPSAIVADVGNSSTVTLPTYALAVNSSDNSGVNPAVTLTPLLVSNIFAVGNYRFTATSRDSSQNKAECSFNISVLDSQPPVLSGCPVTTLPVQASSDAGAKSDWNIPTATDNDALLAPPIADYVPQLTIFPVGNTTVIYTVKDRSGNEAKCSFTVTVTALQNSTSSASNSASSSSASTTIIISVVVGVVTLVIATIVVVWQRAKRNSKQPHNFEAILQALSDINAEDGPRKPREVKRSAVKLLDELGKGNFGVVSKGLLTEIVGTPGYLVAIKILHESFDADRTGLLQEAAVMAQFVHERVVGLIGVVTVDTPLMVIIEFCEHGALNRYLERRDTDLKTKFLLAGDCADGLAYLASRNFVHRDVAARNVLVSSEHRAKISDFGMSRETVNSDYYQSKGGQIPVRWSAPEALEDRKYSEKSDVWSFGILVRRFMTVILYQEHLVARCSHCIASRGSCSCSSTKSGRKQRLRMTACQTKRYGSVS